MPDAPVAAPIDPKATANNIAKAALDKANGKAPDGGRVPLTATSTPADPNAGKEKYTINGKDIYLTPEQAKAYVQKGIAFEPKVSELARIQKETAAFLDVLKTDPEKVLFNKNIGLTPSAVLKKILTAEVVDEETKELVGKWYYENVYSASKRSPQEQEALDNKRELDKLKAEKAKAAADLEKQEHDNRVKMALQQVKANIAEAMKEAGLPHGDSALAVQMAKRVADVMRVSYFAKKPVTPKEAIGKVRGELKAMQKAFLETLEPEKLVEELGPDLAEKVRKHFLKLVKEDGKPREERGSPAPRKGERKIISPDDMRDYLDKLKRGEDPEK